MTHTYIEDRPAEGMTLLAGSVVGTGLKTVRLTPDGEVRSKKGVFIVDKAAARLVIDAFDTHGVELPVDFEHQTLGGEYAAPSGRAPAAGWITKLWYDAGRGLMALIAWGDEAREAIRSSQYAYLSPVLKIRSDDRRVVEVHSAALTNKPAIPRMERLAASENVFNEETGPMADEPEQGDENRNENGNEGAEALLIKIKKKLGLEKQMTIPEILAAVLAKLSAGAGGETVSASERGDAETPDQLVGELKSALLSKGVKFEEGSGREEVLQAAIAYVEGKSKDSTVAESVRTALGLKQDAGQSEVLLAMKLADTRAETLVSQADREREANDLVGNYVAIGKLNAKDKDGVAAATALALEDPDRMRALMSNAASVMPPQGRTKPPNPSTMRRVGVIQKALRYYLADPQLQKQTSQDAYVGLALREADLPKLDEGELTQFV